MSIFYHLTPCLANDIFLHPPLIHKIKQSDLSPVFTMAMATRDLVYSIDQEIADFFAKTTVTHSECDTFAKSVSAETSFLSLFKVYTAIQSTLGPIPNLLFSSVLRPSNWVLYRLQISLEAFTDNSPRSEISGTDRRVIEGKELLHMYFTSRVQGISSLDFILAHNTQVPENSPQSSSWRKTLVADIAKYAECSHILVTRTTNGLLLGAITPGCSVRFFALSWNGPQSAGKIYRDKLDRYKEELGLLLVSLLSRFHPIIQKFLGSLLAIFSLPMVLLHKDFGVATFL